MLRITHASEGPSEITLKLEGRVMSDWVPLLRQECLRILNERKKILLDFSGVIFIDNQGVEMLRGIAGKEVKLVNCSSFIEGVLREGENP